MSLRRLHNDRRCCHLGWILFVGVVFLYIAGNKLNAVESNALAVYSLALVLSDDFRNGLATGVRRSAREALAKHSTPEAAAYSLMQGITHMAKLCYRHDAALNSVAVAANAISES